MWTTIIARVRDVIFAATCSTSMSQVSEHASTTTGVAPARIIAAAQEIIVNVGRMTSSPFFRSSAVTDTSKAADPLQTATAYLRPSLFATCGAFVRRFYDDSIADVDATRLCV